MRKVCACTGRVGACGVQQGADDDSGSDDGDNARDNLDIRIPVGAGEQAVLDGPIIRINGPTAEVQGRADEVSNAVTQAVLLYATHPRCWALLRGDSTVPHATGCRMLAVVYVPPQVQRRANHERGVLHARQAGRSLRCHAPA